MKTIDITPSWGEWGNVFFSLAKSGEHQTLKHLRADFAIAMSSTEALKKLSLTEEQKAEVHKIMKIEMRKQGYTNHALDNSWVRA